MKYTTRNQWLSYVYNTVPEEYNANIQVSGLVPDPGREYLLGHGIISVTRLRHSANHNAPESLPISAHLASQNDELGKNRRISERLIIEEQQ